MRRNVLGRPSTIIQEPPLCVKTVLICMSTFIPFDRPPMTRLCIMTWKFRPFPRVNISVQIIFIIWSKNRENPQFSRHYDNNVVNIGQHYFHNVNFRFAQILIMKIFPPNDVKISIFYDGQYSGPNYFHNSNENTSLFTVISPIILSFQISRKSDTLSVKWWGSSKDISDEIFGW